MANYAEVTMHGVEEIVIEQHPSTLPDSNYHVMNIGVRGKDGKLLHLTLFSDNDTGRISVTKLGDIDAKE